MAYFYPMEEMIIVYFLKKENCAAKQKRRGPWQYFVEEEKVFTPGGYLMLYTVQIPAFFYKKKSWQDKMLSAYLGELCIPPSGDSVLYVFETQAEELLHVRNKPLSRIWLGFLLDYYQPCFTNLIILEDKQAAIKEVVKKYVPYVRYVGFSTGNVENCELFCEELCGEYGILPEVAENVRGLHPLSGSRLIIGADNLYGISPAWMGTETVWLSATVNSDARRICARARDAIYIDIEVFLEDVLRP